MFYVYGLIDGSTGKCFYVGKGSDARMYCHVKKVKRGASTDNPHLDRKISKLIREGVEIQYVKFYDNIADEDEAYQLEETMTHEIGIENLCNAWHGGKGGRIPSDETRKKISENRKGIPVSDQARENMRRAKIGTRVSDETRQKKSEALKGRAQTPAQREANAARSAAHKGRTFTDEHKQKLRDAKLKNPVRYWQGKTLSNEHKAKISTSLSETLKAKNEQPDE